MLLPISFLLCLEVVLAIPAQQLLSPSQPQDIVNDSPATTLPGPDVGSAESNANHIFNSIHSSMRQWGSSLRHNGMSFFLASVPEGTLLYHGTHTKERIKGTEWLAFEIDHAENFARSRGPGGRPGGPGKGPGKRPPGGGGPPGRGGRGRGPPGGEPPQFEELDPFDLDGEMRPNEGSGYLHTYQTNRPLNRLLYIDGLSAGKTSLGTLDSQDHLLLNLSNGDLPMMGEFERAKQLCELGKKWDIDGFLRLEAGFEIIYCNFSEGLDLLSASRRPTGGSTEPNPEDEDHAFETFEYLRSVAARYHGIGAGRVELDYSSMVSAYFYPLNLSNPEPVSIDEDLPRLVSIDAAQRRHITHDLESVLLEKRSHPGIHWQGVVDMIISRYSDRLKFMASDLSAKAFRSEINHILNTFLNYDNADPVEAAINSCSSHYLRPADASSFTRQDVLISAAIETVTWRICETLFEVREILLDSAKSAASKDDDGESAETASATAKIRSLISWLDWTTWKECGRCGYDEVCLVAIWPWGSDEDHFHPSCKNVTAIEGRGGYWRMGERH